VKTKTGVERIAAERKRQVEEEGWSPEHDDEHEDGELGLVAALYATPIRLYAKQENSGWTAFHDPWPGSWDTEWDKRPPLGNEVASVATRIRMLEKAGALIAAEIDRLLRAAPADGRKGTT
jgi:hypothetical protein